jgi:hypothetical protein
MPDWMIICLFAVVAGALLALPWLLWAWMFAGIVSSATPKSTETE